jgi:predicted kinase
MKSPATLFLICGLPCSGKTTLAKQIEHDRAALRLTPDEWIGPILPAGWQQAELDRLRAPVEALQWALAERALSLGLDVVVDFGVWSRRERDEFRSRAAGVGARTELRYLDVPKDELLTRLVRRNAALPQGTFHIAPEQIERWAERFEPPSADELERTPTHGHAVIVLTGASGAGKTAMLAELERRAIPGVLCIHSREWLMPDGPAVPGVEGRPSDEQLVAHYGDVDAYWPVHARRWMDYCVSNPDAAEVIVIETQMMPADAREELPRRGVASPLVVLVNCDTELRHARLVHRGQPELASNRMDCWAAYLKGQADALGVPEIDTTELSVEGAADALTTHLDALRRTRS